MVNCEWGIGLLKHKSATQQKLNSSSVVGSIFKNKKLKR